MEHTGARPIRTERLLLRKHRLSDAGDMYRNWAGDPRASRFWGWDAHQSVEETRAYLKSQLPLWDKPDAYCWIMIHTLAGEAVGYIYLAGLDANDKSATIHYLVAPSYWGQGIATEAARAVLAFAFNQLGLTRVHTHHHIDNPASGRVLEKCGMSMTGQEERAMAECPAIGGVYLLYQITRQEWEGPGQNKGMKR